MLKYDFFIVPNKWLGPRGDEVTGGWRTFCNEEFRGLYFSPDIIRVIKPRRILWAGHVARTSLEFKSLQAGKFGFNWEDDIKRARKK